jgi:ATP-dependent protease HslVU (ClpYQ) ATPase subunit
MRDMAVSVDLLSSFFKKFPNALDLITTLNLKFPIRDAFNGLKLESLNRIFLNLQNSFTKGKKNMKHKHSLLGLKFNDDII